MKTNAPPQPALPETANPGGDPHSRPEAPVPKAYELDESDRCILRHLQSEGRLQIRQLAARLRMPPTSVHKRLHRLQNTRYILAVEAVLDPDKFSARLLAFGKVKLEPGNQRAREAFEAAAQAHPGVMECHRLESGHDFIVKVRVADIQAYKNLMFQLMEKTEGVRGVHSLMVMEVVKQDRRIPI